MKTPIETGPFTSFFAIHFEVGGNTKNLKHQEKYWASACGLVKLCDSYNVKLTLQLTPQWAEYILADNRKIAILRQWQSNGHELSLHHHGYDHMDWDGFTNRESEKSSPRFRGNVQDMMHLMNTLVHPSRIYSGTITDEDFDYPSGVKYDTEGMFMNHARSIPRKVVLGGNEVIQVSMALLSSDDELEDFKQEYIKSEKRDLFGVVTHEYDFYKNPDIIEEWIIFVHSQGGTIQTISKIINDYQKDHAIMQNDSPLTFSGNFASP